MSWKEFLEQVAAGGEFNKGEDGEWSASSLTDAEKKVLVEILPTSNGGELTQKEVGEKLFIGLTTVKSHLDRIYDKLQVDEKGGRITKLRKKLQDKFKLWSLKELAVTQIHSSQSVQKFNWRTACQNQLDKQKQQLTSSPLRLKARSLDDVHVPLGLMERKEKERPKFADRQEFSPEHGSEAYHQGYTEAKRVEHEAFLAEIGKRQPGEHVVILGEPGAGKTTLLMKVWEWLLVHEQPGEDIIVAWVPLAVVKNNELEDYLKKSWIKPFCKSGEIDRYWASFEELADAGRVWLLLDGADEMGGDALSKIEWTLRENWALRTRAVITCRLNLWDASPTNKLLKPNFQVYRTLDFKYANPAGLDEVKAFIDNWFRSTAEPMAGQKLRVTLDEAGKERIKDLAQNPLRLTLLCDIWDDKKELPDTQARLYELFVDYVYRWKADEFPVAVQLRGELDAALGDLAKQGINKPMLRFRFTGAELEQRLPSFEHRKALMDLGWLNCVGEEDRQEVFAFFHPTFQEYFAACSIDDWDYFLPRAHVVGAASRHENRPVNCQSEDEPTCLVFEQEWRQVILLWAGRNDVTAHKEDFIESLVSLVDYGRIKGRNYHDKYYEQDEDEEEYRVVDRDRLKIIDILLNIDKKNSLWADRLISSFEGCEPDWYFRDGSVRDYISKCSELIIKNPTCHSEAVRRLITNIQVGNKNRLHFISKILITIAKDNLFAIAQLIRLLYDGKNEEEWKFASKILCKIASGHNEASKYLRKICIESHYNPKQRIYAVIALISMGGDNLLASSCLNSIANDAIDEDIKAFAIDALCKNSLLPLPFPLSQLKCELISLYRSSSTS